MYAKYNIMGIGLLPMGENEFKTVEEAREFLRYQLPREQDGDYRYQTKGIAPLHGHSLTTKEL